MKTRICTYTIASLVTLLTFSTISKAQSTYWERLKTENIPDNMRLPTPKAMVFKNDLAAITTSIKSGNNKIELPSFQGVITTFTIKENQVLHPLTAAENPEIKTYIGQSENGENLRITISPSGLMGYIFNSAGDELYLQPTDRRNPTTIVVYLGKDTEGWSALTCGVKTAGGQSIGNSEFNRFARTNFGDGLKRTYTISVAATGEYTAWAGSQSNALAAITTTINNVNAIYENELAISFLLKSPTSILYTNATTDPYSEGAGTLSSTTLDENRNTLNADLNVTSGTGYDLGHVFNAGWSGGLAQLNAVCNTSGKGRAASGLNSSFPTGPSGPIFDRTVAHEIGHQYSATHSFSASTGSCSGNITGTTGWEPGGGSTIMSYGGSCASLSYQNRVEPYFHGGNLGQMSSFMTGAGNTCATTSSISNAAPVLQTIPTSYTIPHSTPFRLTLPSTDADGDAITTNWEQMNAVGGTGRSTPPSSTSTTGPNFRSFPPNSKSNVQYFPSFSGYNSGDLAFEVLPTVARTMNFRGTARDNHTGAGRTANQDVTVTTANCGPFSITSNTAPVSLVSNGTNTTTLTWNTASACVTCTNINIKFSIDGGYTYPYIVLANTPNDGTENFIVPNFPTCEGRFMIACADNIFYNVSKAKVEITSNCLAYGAFITPATPFSAAAAGDASLNMTISPDYGTQIPSVMNSQSLTNSDPESILGFKNSAGNCISSSGNYTHYDAIRFVTTENGSHTISKPTTSSSIVLNLYENEYFPNDNCRNFITSSATLNGNSVSNASSLTAVLCQNKTYVLVISTFSNTSPSLPATYNLSFAGPSSGTQFYTSQPKLNTAPYYFIIVNAATGNIVNVQNNADLSNSTMYPAGNYTIYGLNSTKSITDLNTTYKGGAFQTLYNQVVSRVGSFCASFSTNSRQVNINGPALPVTLVSFEAQWKSKGVAEAAWSVTQEMNLASYTLQRSYTNKDFTDIKTVAAAITAGQFRTYKALDAQVDIYQPLVFYRLKMMDFDGTMSFSGVTKLSQNRQSIQQLTVAPNPIAKGILKAEVWLSVAEPLTTEVLDMLGRKIRSSTANMEIGKNAFEINLSDMPTGIYMVRVTGKHFKAVEKFVR